MQEENGRAKLLLENNNIIKYLCHEFMAKVFFVGKYLHLKFPVLKWYKEKQIRSDRVVL